MNDTFQQSAILFAGGKTGGHLFPGIAVAESLQGVVDRIGFAGSGGRVERTETSRRGYDYFVVNAVSAMELRRRPVRSFLRAAWAYLVARRIVKRFAPSVVIGLGGYVSVPVVLAARHLGVPVTLLEQNVIPGRATRWLSRHGGAVCVAFDETEVALPNATCCHNTGNPIRDADVPQRSHGRYRELVVLGGSQGARSLNEVVPAALGHLDPQMAGEWLVRHQCGHHDAGEVMRAYEAAGWRAEVSRFVDWPQRWIAGADLVVARAGATTLAEIASLGAATILVPYPHAVDDHQRANAEWYASRGAAVIVEESPRREAWSDRLAEVVAGLIVSEQRRQTLAEAMRGCGRPEAASHVARIVAAMSGDTGEIGLEVGRGRSDGTGV